MLAIVLLGSCSSRAQPNVAEGDIIFQTSRSAQSLAIQRATGSPYSHMGLILFQNRRPMVLEAVSPVKYTPLEDWIARGEGGHYVLKRLNNASVVLNPESVERIKRAAGKLLGRPYDLSFEWSDDRMYCSEIVWKLFDRVLKVQLGELQTLGDFDLSDPLVKKKMEERYGQQIPLGERVISPAAMFASPSLETVSEN